MTKVIIIDDGIVSSDEKKTQVEKQMKKKKKKKDVDELVRRKELEKALFMCDDLEKKHKKRRKHHKKHSNSVEPATATEPNNLEIDWDGEWARLKKVVVDGVCFFVPPIILYVFGFIIRLILYPYRMLVFVKLILFDKLLYGIVFQFIKTLYEFPHCIILKVLLYGQNFAKHTIENMNKLHQKILQMSIENKIRFNSLSVTIYKSLVRVIKKLQKRIRRWAKYLYKHLFFGIIDSTLSGSYRLVYLVLLPFRATFYGILSITKAGRITFSSFSSIPIKVGLFVINSPTIFGQSGRKFVKYLKTNKQDVYDVFIALIFLTLLGMLITGIFFPIVVDFLRGSLDIVRIFQNVVTKFRLPRLRIPRLNVAKLAEYIPSLPFKLPPLPIPDFGLLFGFRERTFMEKVVYIFSS